MLVIDGVTYGLTGGDLQDRLDYINASEAPTIVNGGPEKRHKLWLQKTGQAAPDNLDEVLIVQMGSYTEAFNVHWFERTSGLKVIDRQRVIKDGFLRCTLDGMATYRDADCVVEAKFMSAYANKEERILSYMPQLFVQMHLSKARQAILTVLNGSPSHEWVLIDWEEAYAATVLRHLSDFHTCVQLRTPPDGMQNVVPPPISAMKTYNMTGHNEWALHAVDWLTNKGAADAFKVADKGIKAVLPEDALEASGHGITVKRSKNSAISIRKTK